MESFLDGEGGTLHIRAGDNCMPSAFLEVLIQTARRAPRSLVAAVVDPNNQLTASPLAAFRAVLLAIGGEAPFVPPQHQLSLSVASDVRTLFGSVTIENVTVNGGSFSESEELGALIDLVNEQIKVGRRFDNLLVVFRNCHDMDVSLRRSFYFSIWEPALSHMTRLGAKMVFQYEPARLATDMSSLPPIAERSIVLPSELVDVVEELAELALRRTWELDISDARVLARTVLATSQDVRQIHTAMAMLELRKASISQ